MADKVSTESKIHTNLDAPITYSGDDVIVGWSDTTPDSATASSASGGGYVKLDDSFLTGETIVTLPVSKKLYAVDDNGNLKKDDNGNAIEASWNEQSLHKLRKGFITSVSSSPLSLVYKTGSQGVGFLARTTTINLAVAAATRFSNSRQRSKYITCDATFINPNDPASMTSADGDPGRFTIKNAKLNVLEFTPQYPDSLDGDMDSTTSTDIEVDDSVMYQIGYSSDDNVLGRLNIGLDFETISRIEEWDLFLNEVAGTRNSRNFEKLTFFGAKSRYNSIMKLELSIHKNGSKPSSNQAISSPTFSFFVAMLPRDNLGLEYDASSSYVSRNYSFQIVEPRRDNIKFSYLNNTPDGTRWNFIIKGHLDEREPIKITAYSNNDMDIPIALENADRYMYFDRELNRLNYLHTNADKINCIHSNICVTFKIDDVILLADGENGKEFDEINVSDVGIINPNTTGKVGEELCRIINLCCSDINDGLKYWRSRKPGEKLSKYALRDDVLPILTIYEDYAFGTVRTENFFDFLDKTKATLTGIRLLDNSFNTRTRSNSLTGDMFKEEYVNKVTLALYFSLPRDCDDKGSFSSTISDWEMIPLY